MLVSGLRILVGFVLACLAAGATQVAFVAVRDGLPVNLDLLILMLLAATHAAIWAAPFAVIALLLGLWRGFSGPAYYVSVGAAIALGGFFAQLFTEAPGEPTIANSYAVAAFLTSGLIGGLVASMLAGADAAPDSAAPNPDAA